ALLSRGNRMLRSAVFAVCAVVSAAAASGAFSAPTAADDAVKVPPLKDFKWKCKFENGEALGGYDDGEERFFLNTFGTASAEVTIPEEGEYTIFVEASCTAAEKELAKFKLTCGETVVAKEFATTTEDKKKYTFNAKLKKGKQSLAIEFLNDKFKEGEYDLNLFLHAVSIEPKKKEKEKE
ncbi:MAG: hypothetical protein K2V38_20625, partial [Gemmataceae bacterium]|nr:hypothetical protein [Gemmataceae bacterium]